MALGKSPTFAGAGDLPQAKLSRHADGSFAVSLAYPKASPDLTYRIEHSPDLLDWSALGVGPEHFNEEIGLYERSVIFTPEATLGFLRLRIDPFETDGF